MEKLKQENDTLKEEVEQLKSENLQVTTASKLKHTNAINEMKEILQGAEGVKKTWERKQDEVEIKLDEKDQEITSLKNELHLSEKALTDKIRL